MSSPKLSLVPNVTPDKPLIINQPQPILIQDNRVEWAKRYQAHKGLKNLPVTHNSWYAGFLANYKKQRFLNHGH